jgi:hypothetical protein
MASTFNVNLQLTAGTDFGQEFYLANPDKSPMDITGCKFSAYFTKYPGAIDAVCTEIPEHIHYQVTPFNCSVVNGVGGVYSLSLPKESSKHFQQGKYVYAVNMTDANGNQQQVLNGLLFIDFGVYPCDC